MGVCKRIKRKENTEFTVWEVFEIFKAEKLAYGITNVTVQSYYESLQRITTSLQVLNPKVQDFDKSDILEFICNLQDDGIKTASINHYLRDIRAFFNWCHKEGYINQKIEVKLIKGQESIKETYTEEELKLLLAPPITNEYCPWRSWAIINWILATGNREKTVCNIKIDDVNIPEKEILLRQTKSKKPQIIPMSTELCSVIKQFIRDFRSDAEPEDLADDNYYLIAYDHKYKNLRHYRVDKMKSIKANYEPREGESDFKSFNIVEYSKKVFGMFSGKEEYVKLRCKNHLAGVFIDRFGKDVYMRPDTENPNSFIVTFDVNISPQFYAWLFGLGTSAEILSPDSVKQEFAEMTKSILSLYS